MLKLDDKFLEDLGLGELPTEEKKKMLAHIYETLELRVGMRLAEKMSDEQLEDFEKLAEANDEAASLKWLEENAPNYKNVVLEELDKLKTEVKGSASQILSATKEV